MVEVFIFSRFIHFASLFFILASSLFCAYLSPPEFADHLTKRLLWSQKLASTLVLISIIGLTITQAGQISDSNEELLHLPIWLMLLTTQFGQVYAFMLVGSGIFCLLLIFLGNAKQKIILLSVTILLLSLSFIGHAAMKTGILGNLQRLNQSIHLLCAAYWSAGLVLVIICLNYLKHQVFRQDAILSIMRFSYYGHYVVSLVIITGIINSYLIMGVPIGFNKYNSLLLIKASIVFIMVGIALYNRYVLVPSFKYDLNTRDKGEKTFIYLTLVELVLSLIALALVAVFATFSPS